jgi:hypothetical protein
VAPIRRASVARIGAATLTVKLKPTREAWGRIPSRAAIVCGMSLSPDIRVAASALEPGREEAREPGGDEPAVAFCEAEVVE